MKISVVTVCRNAADALKITHRSVLEQTFADMEYIVVDGNSFDSTVDFLEKANGVTQWISEPDKGIYDAMNKGTQMASGDWVVFMNAGDRFASADTLTRLAKDIEAIGEDTDVIYGDVLKLESGELHCFKAGETRNMHRMFFCHQSALTRREALLSHPFDIRHRYSADFKLYKQLINEGRGFKKVDYPVAIFDTGGVSNTRRSAGLADNMRVIIETDGILSGLPFLLHLFPSYISSLLRGK